VRTCLIAHYTGIGLIVYPRFQDEGRGSTSTNMLFRRKSVEEEGCPSRVLQKRVPRVFAVHFVPRTAPVWHPIEEFSACYRIAAYCTDDSLSTRERNTSPPVAQFRAEASEGFQGAGAVARICAEIV